MLLVESAEAFLQIYCINRYLKLSWRHCLLYRDGTMLTSLLLVQRWYNAGVTAFCTEMVQLTSLRVVQMAQCWRHCVLYRWHNADVTACCTETAQCWRHWLLYRYHTMGTSLLVVQRQYNSDATACFTETVQCWHHCLLFSYSTIVTACCTDIVQCCRHCLL